MIHQQREMRGSKGGCSVVFRRGQRWYHLPRAEYHSLVNADDRDDRETQAPQAPIQSERERDAKRQARAQQLAEEQAERSAQRVEREQYADVVRVLKHSGGVRPFATAGAKGRSYMRGEYEALPSTVRSSKGRLDMDQAAEAVREEVPWLKTETADDLWCSSLRGTATTAGTTAGWPTGGSAGWCSIVRRAYAHVTIHLMDQHVRPRTTTLRRVHSCLRLVAPHAALQPAWYPRTRNVERRCHSGEMLAANRPP